MSEPVRFKKDGQGGLNLFTETGCLSDSSYANYVTGSMSDPDRAALQTHLAQCDSCRKKLGDIIESLSAQRSESEEVYPAPTQADIDKYAEFMIRQIEKTTPKARGLLSSLKLFGKLAPQFAYVSLLLLVLVPAAIYLGMRYTAGRHQQYYAQALENLKSVSKFEAASGLRMIGAIAKVDVETHSVNLRSADLSALEHSIGYFYKAIGVNPNSVQSYIGLGQVYLVKGQPEEARRQFQEALRLEKTNPEATNGLGMAFYDLADLETDPFKKDELLKTSLDAFGKVLAANPNRLEPLYNQALTYYRLGDKTKALTTIDQYLARDSESKWAENLFSVRDKLRLSSYKIFDEEVQTALEKPRQKRLSKLVSSSPNTIWLIKKYLRVALKLQVEGDLQEGRRGFQNAQAVEEAYQQMTGDSNYRQLINFYKDLNGEERREKYRAIRITEEAFAQHQKGNNEAGLNLSTKALSIYQRLHDYWDIAYTHHLSGNCYFYLSDYEQALKAYEAMAIAAQQVGDIDELASALCNLSLIYQYQGNYDKMKTCLDQMSNLADRIKHARHQAFASNYLGNLYLELGSSERALQHYSRALILNRGMGDLNSQLENINHISFSYQRNKEYDRSIGFL